MYIKKMYGYVLVDEAFLCLVKGRLDTFDPPTQESVSYKNWVTYIDGSASVPPRQDLQN